jgi:hypothetical protein
MSEETKIPVAATPTPSPMARNVRGEALPTYVQPFDRLDQETQAALRSTLNVALSTLPHAAVIEKTINAEDEEIKLPAPIVLRPNTVDRELFIKTISDQNLSRSLQAKVMAYLDAARCPSFDSFDLVAAAAVPGEEEEDKYAPDDQFQFLVQVGSPGTGRVDLYCLPTSDMRRWFTSLDATTGELKGTSIRMTSDQWQKLYESVRLTQQDIDEIKAEGGWQAVYDTVGITQQDLEDYKAAGRPAPQPGPDPASYVDYVGQARYRNLVFGARAPTAQEAMEQELTPEDAAAFAELSSDTESDEEAEYERDREARLAQQQRDAADLKQLEANIAESKDRSKFILPIRQYMARTTQRDRLSMLPLRLRDVLDDVTRYSMGSSRGDGVVFLDNDQGDISHGSNLVAVLVGEPTNRPRVFLIRRWASRFPVKPNTVVIPMVLQLRDNVIHSGDFDSVRSVISMQEDGPRLRVGWLWRRRTVLAQDGREGVAYEFTLPMIQHVLPDGSIAGLHVDPVEEAERYFVVSGDAIHPEGKPHLHVRFDQKHVSMVVVKDSGILDADHLDLPSPEELTRLTQTLVELLRKYILAVGTRAPSISIVDESSMLDHQELERLGYHRDATINHPVFVRAFTEQEQAFRLARADVGETKQRETKERENKHGATETKRTLVPGRRPQQASSLLEPEIKELLNTIRSSSVSRESKLAQMSQITTARASGQSVAQLLETYGQSARTAASTGAPEIKSSLVRMQPGESKTLERRGQKRGAGSAPNSAERPAKRARKPGDERKQGEQDAAEFEQRAAQEGQADMDFVLEDELIRLLGQEAVAAPAAPTPSPAIAVQQQQLDPDLDNVMAARYGFQ